MVATKGEPVRHTTKTTAATVAKRGKPVIANKEVYKQRMEEKKAQAAARKAARAAEKAKTAMAEATATAPKAQK